MEHSRQLAKRLQEVMELNEALAKEKKKQNLQMPEEASSEACRISGNPTASGSAESAASPEHIKTADSPLHLEGNSRETVELKSPAELLFVESDGNYALVHYLYEGKEVHKALRCTLKQMEEQLQGVQGIMRCHRAYIVNIAHVEHVSGNGQGYRLTLKATKEQVSVSRQYTAAIYRSIRI